MSIISLLSVSNYLIFNIEIAKKLSPNLAIMLGILASQQDYWTNQDKLEDGYFFCTQETIFNKSGLTPDMQSTALKKLISLNIIECIKKGLPAKNYFKINTDVLLNLITNDNKPLSSERKNGSLVSGKTAIINNNISNKELTNKLLSKDNNLEKINLDEVKKTIKLQKISLENQIKNYTTNEEIRKALFDFLEMHKEKFKTNPTLISFEKILVSLRKLAGTDSNLALQIIDVSIRRGYRDFFKLNINPFDNNGRVLNGANYVYNDKEYDENQTTLSEITG